MKTYTQTKNKFVLSIMFMAFVLFAVSGILLLKHNTSSVRAEGEPNHTYSYGNEETTIGNVTYSWSITQNTEQTKTAKLYKVTMSEVGELVIPATISKNGVNFEITEMYSSTTNNQNGVFYPSKDKITKIEFANGSKITNIGDNAFYGCTALTNATIPTNITSIGANAFAGCTSLQTIYYFANINNTFTYGKGMFAGSGTSLNLNIGKDVTSIPAYAFSGMNNITNVYFQNGAQVATIAEGAFMDAKLTNITIPASVTTIGTNAFAGNPNLNIQVDESNTNFAVSQSCLYKLTDSKKTTLLAIPSSATSLTLDADCTDIDALVFYGCTALTAITPNANFAFENNCLYKLVDGKKQILVYVTANATEFNPSSDCTEYAPNAFINAKDLTKLTINANIADEAYEGVTTITEVVINEGVTSIGAGAFYNCTEITTVTIPSSVTIIGEGAFDGCTKLTTVNYNATNASINATLVAYSDVFNNAGTAVDAGLTFNVGANVTHIPAGLFTVYDSTYAPKLTAVNFAEGSTLTTIGDYAFYMMSTLTSIDFPATLTTIGTQSFEGAGITSIVFPSSVTSVGNKAFYLCDDLTSVKFTYTDDSVNVTIGNQAFVGTSVQELTLSNKITLIGTEAFKDCADLTKVTFTNASMSNPQVTIGAGAFLGNNAEVKYYFYDHAYTLSNEIFTNTTNNNIYVINLYNGEDVYATYYAPAGDVIDLPTITEIVDNKGVVGWSRNREADSGEFTYTVIAETEDTKNVLYAIWQDRYIVTFEKNGGIGGSDTVTAILNADMPNIELPTCKGYSFDGYYSGDNATGIKYYNADGTSNRPYDSISSIKLYASWVICNYTITFEDGEGYTITAKKNGEDFTSGSTITINDTLVFTINVTNANGYQNPVLTANGTEGTYTFDGNTLSGVSGDIEITGAVTINTFTVTFESGEGYTINVKKNGADFTSGDTVKITDELVITITSSTGYTAGEMNISSVAAGAYTRNENTISNIYSNLTITASATLNNYTITFSNGEGYTITATKGNAEFTSGSSVTILDSVVFTITADTGYTAGELIAGGADDTYTFDANTLSNVSGNVTITGSVTASQYTVSWENGVGYTITATKNSADFTSGETVTINDTLTLTITANTGYTVGNIIVSGTDADRTFDGTQLSRVNASLTITGSATPNTYNIIYNSNKPASATGAVSGVMQSTTMTYNVQSNLRGNAFMLTGYTFNGWATDINGSVVYDDAQEVTNLSSTNDATINLYAVWSPITYKVEYHKVKPTTATTEISGETLANENIVYDTEFTLRTCNFTLAGYNFAGWSLTENGAIAYDNEQTVSNLSSTQDGVVALYSVFTPVTYQIKFNTEKPTSSTNDIEGTMSDYTATFDSAITLPVNEYTLRGYNFIGWAIASGGAVVYDNNANIATNLANTQDAIIELYTVWEMANYTITYANSNTCDIVVKTYQGADFDSGTTVNIDNVLSITLAPKAGYSLAENLIDSIIINADASKYDLTITDAATFEFTLQDVSQDLTISVIAYANTDTPYLVEHYQQNINDTEYTLVDTDNLTGTTDTNTNAESNTYTGFEAVAFEQVNINGDGSTVVKIYYNRINHTITFVVDDAKGTTTDELVYTLPYGANVTIPTITSTHYEFLGWDTTISNTVEGDATYTASFTPKKYNIQLNINDTTAGAIDGGHTIINNVPYGTKITAIGNVLTVHIDGAPVTINAVPTPTEPSNNTQYRLMNWYYNGITAITMNGVFLDSANASIIAQFEKRIIYITNTAGQLDLSDSNGVAENSEAKFVKIAGDDINPAFEVPAGKRAVQSYSINIFEKDGNTVTNTIVPTTGEIVIKLNVAEDILLSTGLQVLVLDSSNSTVYTYDATIIGNQLVFTTNCLGQMLIVADIQTSFPWWIVVLTILVIVAILVLYLVFTRRPVERVENTTQSNADYDGVLTGLVEDKKQKETEVTQDNATKTKKTTTTKTTTTTTTQTKQKPENKSDK